MMQPLKIATLTTLFPHAADAAHGVFVETRLRHLVATGRAEVAVVAPVPWVPPGLRTHPRYAAMARAPETEMRAGMRVVHPRYLVIPRAGMTLAPFTLAAAFLRGLRRLGLGRGDIDLIDAHYAYPDGVAAAMVGSLLGLPVTITGRGTDLNLIPRYPVPRRMLRRACRSAAAMITVCEALAEPVRALGVPGERVHVLRNGVDLELFRPPGDRAALRADLDLKGPVLLSVGHLVERKGHHLAVEALQSLPDCTLLIAGEGEERTALEGLIRGRGLSDRVRLLGRKSQAELVELYGAADALVLASSREGWANVLLEAMACGTPVLATPVWGTPEVVRTPEAGILMEERSAAAIAAAARTLLAAPPDRSATRRYAEGFSWSATIDGLLDLFTRIAAERRSADPILRPA